jgi:integrase
MTIRNQLRPEQVDAAIDSGTRRKLADGGSLFLLVRGEGRAWWLTQFRAGTSFSSRGLGKATGTKARPGAVTLAAARRARDALHVARRNGELATMPRSRAARPAGQLFGEVWPMYLKAREKDWTPSHAAGLRRLLEMHASALDRRPIGDITMLEVIDVLRPIWTGPGNGVGSKLRGLIERIMTAAKVSPNPATWKPIKEDLESDLRRKAPKPEHHEAMPLAELPAFIAELRAIGTTVARALEFTILTAARTTETLKADWSEFDFDKKLWIVPAERMKSDRAHRVPLSDRAIELLGPKGTGIVFPSSKRRRAGKPLFPGALYGLHRELRDRYTPHGFRSTFRDFVTDHTSYPREMAEIALAHRVGDDTEEAYARSDMIEKRRKLMQEWADVQAR